MARKGRKSAKKHARKVTRHKLVAAKVVYRKHGYLYFVDAQGNVREAKMVRGAKKGHRSCR